MRFLRRGRGRPALPWSGRPPNGPRMRLVATAVVSAIAGEFATWPTTAEVLARAGFIHRERTTIHSLAVEEADCLLRLGVGRHRDESKAAGFPRELILHQCDFGDRAGFGKGIL